jgi:hypothetical protein
MDTLKPLVQALEAQIRDLTQRLYGKKSEKSAGSEALGKPTQIVRFSLHNPTRK